MKNSKQENKRYKIKFYKKTWFTVLMLILFFPVGIPLMWIYREKWHVSVKIVISVLFAMIMVSSVLNPSENSEAESFSKGFQEGYNAALELERKNCIETEGVEEIKSDITIESESIVVEEEKTKAETKPKETLLIDQSETDSIIEHKENTLEIEDQTELLNKDNKYLLNDFLNLYNETAEFNIDSEMMQHIQEVKRPLFKFTYVFSNGVYVILRYDNYSKILSAHYQEENNTDENIYPIFRDFCKTILKTIEDKEILEVWEELKTLEYQYYDEYDFLGIKCTYNLQNLINGKKRYYIKMHYQY